MHRAACRQTNKAILQYYLMYTMDYLCPLTQNPNSPNQPHPQVVKK